MLFPRSLYSHRAFSFISQRPLLLAAVDIEIRAVPSFTRTSPESATIMASPNSSRLTAIIIFDIYPYIGLSSVSSCALSLPSPLRSVYWHLSTCAEAGEIQWPREAGLLHYLMPVVFARKNTNTPGKGEEGVFPLYFAFVCSHRNVSPFLPS
jgi:hypothetical protein